MSEGRRTPPNQDIEVVGTAITAALSQLASAEYQASIKAQVAPLTLSEITDGLVNIYGILWDPATTHSSMLFQSRRLVHSVVESALETYAFTAKTVVTPARISFSGMARQDKIAAVTMMRNGEIIPSILKSALKGISIGHVLVGDPVDNQDTQIGMLESMGVAPTTIQALSDAGFATVDAVAYAGRDTVTQVEGIGEARVDGILGKAAEAVGQNNHATAFYAKFGSSLKSRKVLLLDLCINNPSGILKAIEVLGQHDVVADDVTVVCLFISEPALLLIHRTHPAMKIVASGIYKSTAYAFSPGNASDVVPNT